MVQQKNHPCPLLEGRRGAVPGGNADRQSVVSDILLSMQPPLTVPPPSFKNSEGYGGGEPNVPNVVGEANGQGCCFSQALLHLYIKDKQVHGTVGTGRAPA
jgi:hypothetical protein